MTTDQIKEAIKDLSDDAFMLESGAGNNISTPKKMAAQIRLLITENERLREDLQMAKIAEGIQYYKNADLRARIAEQNEIIATMDVQTDIKLHARIIELEKDRPEVVTRGALMDALGDLREKTVRGVLHFEYYATDYLQYKYPNGIKIVQDKEGG